MSQDEKRRLADHVAGATVVHQNPFSRLAVPTADGHPERDFVEKWIQPFYMVDPSDSEFAHAFQGVAAEVDDAVIDKLLAHRNWRSRIVGAFFVAILRKHETTGQVRALLLRSDVCYAGRGYCLALATLNGEIAVSALQEYLEYYLTQPQLWFEQAEALAALDHLDQANGTSNADDFHARWVEFVSDKPNWDLDRTKERFRKSLEGLEACAKWL